MKKILLTLALLALYHFCFSQYQIGLIPRESSDKGVYQKIGFTAIDIHYGSPKVKGRNIWGDLVPYNQVWRAGSNNATTIEFSNDVKINGQLLKQGKYALFIIPQKNEKWVIIFSKHHDQWGSFSYKKEEDALRIEALPLKNIFQESLSYQIQNYGHDYARVLLSWEYLELSFEVQTNYIQSFQKLVEERVSKSSTNSKWVAYIQGADFLVQQNKNNELALSWLNKSEALFSQISGEWNKQFYPKNYILGHLYWVKAKALAKNNSFEEALKYVEQAKTLEGKYNFYKRKFEKEKIEQYIETWKSKLNK